MRAFGDLCIVAAAVAWASPNGVDGMAIKKALLLPPFQGMAGAIELALAKPLKQKSRSLIFMKLRTNPTLKNNQLT